MANSKLTMLLLGVTSAPANCTGQFSCSLADQETAIQEGAADSEQNSVFSATPNILASGSLTIDFAVINNIVNEQFITAAGDLAALLIKNLSVADGGGGGNVDISPSAVDGWVSWLAAGSVMHLPAGCSVQLNGLPAGSYPVTAVTNSFDIVEVGTVNAADLEIELWARK